MTVFYIVIAVLVLLFGFFSYLNAAKWNVLHVLGLFLTFGAGFAFLVLSAAVLKTELAWQKYAEQKADELAELQERVDLLANGFSIDPDSGSLNVVENNTDSLVGVKAELDRIMYNRGRVWRNAQRGPVNNKSVTVTLPPISAPAPADPNAAPSGAAPAPAAPTVTADQRSLAVDDIVYAYGEVPVSTALGKAAPPVDPNQNTRPFMVPGFFVGEFVVRNINGQVVTLESTTELDNIQQRLLALPNTWTLYDKMPPDEHEIFEGYDDQQLDDIIRGASKRLALAPAIQDAAVTAFQRTGKAAQNDDPEITVLSKVTFQKDYEIEVDTANDAQGATQLFESATGLAAANFLKQGEPSKFTKGDQMLISTSSGLGKSLLDQGIVTEDDRYYYRPLNDYAYLFHAYKARVAQLKDTSYVLQKSIETITEADQIAQNLVMFRKQEETDLRTDRDQVLYELEQIDQYRAKVRDHLTEVLKENSQLYRANQTMVDELQRISDQVIEKIEQEKLKQDQSDSLTLAN